MVNVILAIVKKCGCLKKKETGKLFTAVYDWIELNEFKCEIWHEKTEQDHTRHIR